MFLDTYHSILDTYAMRFLGVDYGDMIGLALSDESGVFAFPHSSLPSDGSAVAAIARICTERGVGAIIVGDTRAMNGGMNPITERSDRFADALGKATGLPVHREREAWSSVEAARFAPQGDKHNDAAAAAIILQRFLDSPRT
jgi:putative transcription antitermination factor YqgF